MTQIFKDENICDLRVINGASAAHKLVWMKHKTVLVMLMENDVKKWGVTSLFPSADFCYTYAFRFLVSSLH